LSQDFGQLFKRSLKCGGVDVDCWHQSYP
jgi:hypothetical protein